MTRNVALEIECEVIDKIEAALPYWQALEEHGHSTPFQARSWLLAWYRLVAPALGAEPRLALVRSRHDGAPLMLLPLCRTVDAAGYAKLAFAGGEVSDYNAPLLAANYPASLRASSVWKSLARKLDADYAYFDKLPPDVGPLRNPLTELAGVSSMPFGSWCFPLPGTMAEYERDILPTRMRKEVRRCMRRLELEGRLTFTRAQTAEERRQVFHQLARQREARFAQLDRVDVLKSQRLRTFYEAVALDPEQAGFASLYALRIDDEIIASLFGLRQNGGYHLVFFSFTGGDWQSFSPGKVALLMAIEAEIGGGSALFDLTIGDEPYKRRFGARRSPLYCAARALSLRSLPKAVWHNAVARIKEQARDVMNDGDDTSLLRKAMLGLRDKARSRQKQSAAEGTDV